MSEETQRVIILHSKGTKAASLWNPWEGCAKRLMHHPAEVKPDENVCLGTHSTPIHWGF